MRLTEEDATSIKMFRERANELQKLGDPKTARQLNIWCLQTINREVVAAIKEGDLPVDETGKSTDDFTFTDIPPEALMKAGKRGIDLNLLLIEDSPLTRDILAVLEKHVMGDF